MSEVLGLRMEHWLERALQIRGRGERGSGLPPHLDAQFQGLGAEPEVGRCQTNAKIRKTRLFVPELQLHENIGRGLPHKA